MKEKISKKVDIVIVCLFFIEFLFFLVFFTNIHPIQIFDMDDWIYAYYTRNAYPIWKNWNPARVLPEVLMPWVSEFAAYVLYPIFGGIFECISFSYALVVSVLIVLECILIHQFLLKNGLSKYVSLACTSFFVISHFWIFRINPSNNMYMFRGINATAYFYYVIPNLLNCILSILIILLTKMHCKISGVCKSLLIVGVYFSIFSNLFSSIILAGILLADMFLFGIECVKSEKHGIFSFLKKKWINILGIIFWIISLIFEFNGGRAGEEYNWKNYGTDLLSTFNNLISVIRDLMNRKFIYFSCAIFIALIAFFVIRKQIKRLFEIAPIILAFIIVTFFELLLIARVNSNYIFREDVLYGIFFYFMVALIWSISVLLSESKGFRYTFPLLLVIFSFNCNTSEITYMESNLANFSPQTVLSIDYEILEQIEIAHDEGQICTIVTVPEHPIVASNLAQEIAKDRFCNFLTKLGVIDYHIDVTIKMDED